jgi:hypothetical protein
MGPFREGWTAADVEAVIARGDPNELLYAPIVVSMDPPEYEWAESVCLRLASHSHPQVRANAILGFGHLARTCGRLNETVVRPIVEGGLLDESQAVRGHASSAADDIEVFLGWRIDRR